MNNEIKKLIKPQLFLAFSEIAKDDLIAQSILKKSNSIEEFINSVLAGFVCISERENQTNEILSQIVNNNPQVKTILETKNNILKDKT